MTKPRVLHVTQAVGADPNLAGGVAVVMLDLARMSRDHGYPTAIAAPSHPATCQAATTSGIRYFKWEAGREPDAGTLAEIRRLRTIIDDFRPDIVHLHSSKAGLAGRLLVRGEIPTIFSPHAWSFLHGGARTNHLATAWERFAARWTTVYMCVGEDEMRRGKRQRIRGDYRVVSNTVDVVHPGLTMEEARRARLPDVATDSPLALCIGRLAPQKGQDILLRAWPEVLKAVPSATLAIVGSGPDEEALKNAAPRNVIFVGAVPRADVPIWNIAADAVVFPSRWEGNSLGVLEALQLGRLVIASDCDGMREALPDGFGALFPTEDTATLARLLSTYLGDRSLAAAEGDRAAVQYARTHGARRRSNMAAYRQILDELAGAKHP